MENPQKKIENFFAKFSKHTYSKGDIILTPDDELTSLYYIVQGNVRMYALSESGDLTTLTIFQPGAYFPLMLILVNQKNEYYFDALTNVTILSAPKSNILEFIQENDDVLFDITTRFAGAINGLTKRITETSTNNLSERIESLQTYIRTKFSDSQFHLRHEDIANWLGVSRETVSRTMAKKKFAQ